MGHQAIVFAGLMPHAPILVPGVGREHLAEARRTASAMSTVAHRAVAAGPETVLVISPHSPRRARAFGLWRGPRLRGSFARFGSPEDRVELPADETFANRLEDEAAQRSLRTWHIAEDELDHGATVPLAYLAQAGWKGPTVVVGLNHPGDGGLDELGHAIAATARDLDVRLAIIASGDMSHRLTPSAPNGFHPHGGRFDEAFIAALKSDSPVNLGAIDPGVQDAAAEDVVDSTRVALAAAGADDGRRVLSYEGPFGVGYGVAILFEPGAPRPEKGGDRGGELFRYSELPVVARRAVEAALAKGPAVPPFRASGELTEQRGVFVTLREANGRLRGCRGTPEPTASNLVWETWSCARAAALFDDRFEPVESRELARLHISVTILDPLERVDSNSDLDPGSYGVVVAAPDGRRGLLLPAIEGIDSVEQQVAIAREKGGIGPGEPIEIWRFAARTFAETRSGR